MQTRNRILIVAAGLFAVGAVSSRAYFLNASAAQLPQTSPKISQPVQIAETATDSPKNISISELNRKNPTTGNFVIEGFVAKIYSAPTCPPDAECKPAMADNIVLSQDKKSLETYDFSDREILVFTDKIAAFQKGAKYRLLIKITDQKTTGQKINDVRLLNYNRLD